jgi:hypothetical protein
MPFVVRKRTVITWPCESMRFWMSGPLVSGGAALGMEGSTVSTLAGWSFEPDFGFASSSA